MGNVLLVSRRGAIVSPVLVIVVPIIFVSDVHAVLTAEDVPMGCLAREELLQLQSNGKEIVEEDEIVAKLRPHNVLRTDDAQYQYALNFGSMLMAKEDAEPSNTGLDIRAYTHMMILLSATDPLGLVSGDDKCKGIYGDLQSFRTEVNELWTKEVQPNFDGTLSSLTKFYKSKFKLDERAASKTWNFYDAWFPRGVKKFVFSSNDPSADSVVGTVLFTLRRHENISLQLVFAYHYLMTKEWLATHDIGQGGNVRSGWRILKDPTPKKIKEAYLKRSHAEEDPTPKKIAAAKYLIVGILCLIVAALLLVVYVYGEDWFKKIFSGAKQEDAKQGAEEHGNKKGEKGMGHEALSLSYELTPFIPSHSNFDSNGNDHSNAPGCFAGQGCSAP